MPNKEFLRAEDRYHKRKAPRPRTVEVEEYKIPMPVMPDEKMIKNHDKRKKDQFYTREVVPDGIITWKPHEIKEFVKGQWHRRIHGEWQFINGQPYYIPGPAIPFFDFWTLESGKRPNFYYSALTLFWLFYEYVEPHPAIFGIYVLKTRRIGDTANFIYMLWERSTRFKGAQAGLQSYNDTIAGKTFGRLAKGARNMPFFFQPNRSGSDKEFLAYMAPSEVITLKKLKESDITTKAPRDAEFLNSFIDYQPTVEGAYDGEQKFTVLLDEILKVPPHKMNAKKQWENLRRCLSLHGEDYIYGKGFASSTVEKREKKTARPGEGDESSIEIGRWFWDNSDPDMLENSPDGRTVSGLVRIFRGYQMAALPDQYGFPQVERATKFRESKMEKALMYGQQEMLTDIYRKEPGTPDEALIEDNDACPLYPELCQVRRNQVRNGLNRYNEPLPNYRAPVKEGFLKWKNDKRNTEVIFVPAAGGPWKISQEPFQPNQVDMREIKMRDEFGQVEKRLGYVPRNGAFYRAGCDPTGSNPLLVTKGSKNAIVMKRRFYMPHETADLQFNDDGICMNPEKMVTNKVVATYLDRPFDPALAFDEIVKVCWWYGSPVMLEMDKPEAYVYMRKHGYAGFAMFEPPELAKLRSRKAESFFPGIRSKGDIVGMYVTRLKMYIANYWPAIDHEDLLLTASRFIPAKRTKFDLVVAWGMAEMGDMDNRYGLPGQEAVQNDSWSINPYEIETI